MPDRNRHGCLSAYLVLMVLINPISAWNIIEKLSSGPAGAPVTPTWVSIVHVAVCALNFVFALAVYRWKKWGVYGLVVTGFVAFAVNASRPHHILFALLGLSGVAILFGLLHIGEDNKAWSQFD